MYAQSFVLCYIDVFILSAPSDLYEWLTAVKVMACESNYISHFIYMYL